MLVGRPALFFSELYWGKAMVAYKGRKVELHMLRLTARERDTIIIEYGTYDFLRELFGR